jgi:hypothetical protein
MRFAVADCVTAYVLTGGVVFVFVALYAAGLGSSLRDCPSSVTAKEDLGTNGTNFQRVFATTPEVASIDDVAKHHNGKNWSVVKWFDASPTAAQLSELLPELNSRNTRLMYLVNPETEQWTECLVRWDEGTWQHQAILRMQDHAGRAARATKAKDVGKIMGFKWGFGSGISAMARGITHGLSRDEPVRHTHAHVSLFSWLGG